MKIFKKTFIKYARYLIADVAARGTFLHGGPRHEQCRLVNKCASLGIEILPFVKEFMNNQQSIITLDEVVAHAKRLDSRTNERTEIPWYERLNPSDQQKYFLDYSVSYVKEIFMPSLVAQISKEFEGSIPKRNIEGKEYWDLKADIVGITKNWLDKNIS